MKRDLPPLRHRHGVQPEEEAGFRRGREVVIGGSLPGLASSALSLRASGGALRWDFHAARPVVAEAVAVQPASSTASFFASFQRPGPHCGYALRRITAAILIFQDIIIRCPRCWLLDTAGQVATSVVIRSGWCRRCCFLVVSRLCWRPLRSHRLLPGEQRAQQELFIITIGRVVFPVRRGHQYHGPFISLGAFLASHHQRNGPNTRYRHRQPFPELFMSFFFVSIGMLVDRVSSRRSPSPSSAWRYWWCW